jgi:hypothetical protein
MSKAAFELEQILQINYEQILYPEKDYASVAQPVLTPVRKSAIVVPLLEFGQG